MPDHHNGAYHRSPDDAPPPPAGCPIDRDFDPFAANYLLNPYPTLERLTTTQPIFYSTALRCLVLTRMDDIVEVFKRPEIFSSANVQDPVFPLCEQAKTILAADDFDPVAVMSNCQPPDHTRIRQFTRNCFSGRRIRMLEPYIRRLSERLIDRMIDSGSPAEFVNSFAHALPGRIIFRLIGFPTADDEQLMRWTANRLAFTWGRPSEAAQTEIAGNMLRYWRYCRDFVAHRRNERGDDLTAELLNAHEAHPDELSYREVESVVYGLSFAGHEIVSNFIANTLLCLLPDRQRWGALIDDPTLIGNAIDEVLRLESPQISWRRVTTQDTRIGEFDIPAGTRIFLALGAANHDADLFPQPTSFDLQRGNAGKHISFGYGIHYCLGARLARLEGRIAIETLTSRLPGLRLVADQALEYTPNITFRGPRALLVEW